VCALKIVGTDVIMTNTNHSHCHLLQFVNSLLSFQTIVSVYIYLNIYLYTVSYAFFNFQLYKRGQ